MAGALVIVRVGSARRSGKSRRARRPIHDRRARGRAVTLIVRAGGFAETTQTADGGGAHRRARHRRRARGVFETVTVTPTRAEQRLGDVPASVSVLTSDEIQVVAGAASPTTCCGRFRRSACSGAPAACRRTRRRRACRCAASARAARAARSCCSTACRSTIRSAAGCTGRACRSTASTASRSSTDRRPACTATSPWAASSTSSPAGRRGARSSSSRSTATRTARSSTSSPATRGTRSARSSRAAAFKTDGFPIVAAIERGPIDNNADVEYTNVTGEARVHADRPAAVLRPRRLFHRGPRTTARSAR